MDSTSKPLHLWSLQYRGFLGKAQGWMYWNHKAGSDLYLLMETSEFMAWASATLLQSLCEGNTIPNRGKEACQVYQWWNSMQRRKRLIQLLHLLRMRCWIIALLPVSSFLMLPLFHNSCSCGTNPQHVCQASGEHSSNRYEHTPSINVCKGTIEPRSCSQWYVCAGVGQRKQHWKSCL